MFTGWDSNKLRHEPRAPWRGDVVTLRNDIELENTRQRLRELEDRYEELRSDSAEDARVRELTLFSLKQLINQLKEEIVRYEAHHPVRQ